MQKCHIRHVKNAAYRDCVWELWLGQKRGRDYSAMQRLWYVFGRFLSAAVGFCLEPGNLNWSSRNCPVRRLRRDPRHRLTWHEEFHDVIWWYCVMTESVVSRLLQNILVSHSSYGILLASIGFFNGCSFCLVCFAVSLTVFPVRWNLFSFAVSGEWRHAYWGRFELPWLIENNNISTRYVTADGDMRLPATSLLSTDSDGRKIKAYQCSEDFRGCRKSLIALSDALCKKQRFESMGWSSYTFVMTLMSITNRTTR